MIKRFLVVGAFLLFPTLAFAQEAVLSGILGSLAGLFLLGLIINLAGGATCACTCHSSRSPVRRPY